MHAIDTMPTLNAAPLWLQDLGEQVEREVKQANDGAWPLTRPQWRRVARRFGLEIYLAKKPMLWQGMLLGDTAVVQDGLDRWAVLRRICHEVVEGIMECEGIPLLQTPGDASTRHQVARLVDTIYSEYLVFVQAAELAAAGRRVVRRARPDLPELARERDEDADADFGREAWRFRWVRAR